MRTIRPINKSEIDDFITISANAYPGFPLFSEDSRQRVRERLLQTWHDSGISYFALFEDGAMRGIMRLYDFKMNFLSSRALVGGVGGLAVDLLHKKEKVAADMIRFFLRHYRQKGACLTTLYPFRPDFYRRMGYGYGTKRELYRVKPESLPQGRGDGELVFLTVADKEALQACYERFLARKHGLIERFDFSWDQLLASTEIQIVGIKRQGRLHGYLMYKFEKGPQDHFLNNDIVVREMAYDSAADLLELLRFLHLQADQIDRVIFYTQDEFFYYLLHDPRNDSGNLIPMVYHETNTQGVGIMYRVIDVPRLLQVLQDHNFGNETCRLKINLADSFFPENAGSYTIHFQDGQSSLADDAVYDVAMAIDVSEFSSLIMGAINFTALVELGLVSLSDSRYIDRLDRLFAAPKPICFTEF